MNPAQILLLINAATELLALGLDAYRESGATPEEVQARRDASYARIDGAITGVETSEPPAPGSGA